MVLVDERAVRLALDLFYPGRVGARRLFLAGKLKTTPLRETLGRQTGMYRVTGKITDEQVDALVGGLWKRDVAGTLPSTGLPPEKFDPGWDQVSGEAAEESGVPLLCQEACHLLVAEARAVVKGKKAEG